MSSIVYVTDESMLEYHRLCRNRAILFWRLSSRKFADFRKGDLLFFFARPKTGRRKALIGYAHFDSIVRLSLKQMWSRYGQFTGYDSEALLKEAIEKAAKENTIPKQMSCLYLTDVVFFLSPIYPQEAGLDIPNNLESYCYLDKTDPSDTVRILNIAEQRGIDLWSSDENSSPDIIFSHDEIRHQLSLIHRKFGRTDFSEKEMTKARRMAREKCEKENWEMIRESSTDLMRIEDDRILISLPFVSQSNDRDLRIRDITGRMMLYRMKAEEQLHKRILFETFGDNVPDTVIKLTEYINNEQI